MKTNNASPSNSRRRPRRLSAGRRSLLTATGVTLAAALSLLGVAFAFAGAPRISPGAVVRHAPDIQGNGKVVGSVRQILAGEDTELIGEDISLAGGATITGDLLVPGSPTLVSNGNPTFGGVVVGPGSPLPANFSVKLSGNVTLGHLVTHTDPVPLAGVPAPPAAAGTRDVVVNAAGQGAGDFATLRDLTLGGAAGEVAVPPGTYRRFAASGAVAFVFGQAGAARPSVYNLDELSLDQGATLRVAGPVRLNVAKKVSLTNGSKAGAQADALLLALNVAGLGVTGDAVLVDGGSALNAVVRAPSGKVSLRGSSTLLGTAFCDRLSINGASVLQGVGDATAPALAVSEPADGFVTKANHLTVKGTVADQTETAVTVNGAAAVMNGDAFEAGVTLVEGLNTLKVVATDLFGNQSERTLTVKVATTSPAVTVLSPAEGLITRQAQAAVSGTFEDVSAIKVNGVPAVISGNLFSATVQLSEGPNTLTVSALDSAGNVTEVVRHLTLDTTTPALSLSQPAEGLVTKQDQLVVAGTYSDATQVTVTVNGVQAAAADGSFTATVSLAEGQNAVSVAATDAAGNASAASRHVTLDTAPPTVNISQPAAGLITKDAQVNVSGTFADAGAAAGVSVVVNGSPATLAGNTYTASVSLNEGPNPITVRATDAAGNHADAGATVTRDTTAPTLTLLQPSEGQVSKAIDVFGTVEDATPVAVTINGVAASSEGGTFVGQVAGADGANSVHVVATDGAGNTSEVSRSVTLDTTPPVIGDLSPAAGTLVETPAATVGGRVTDATRTSVLVNDKPAALDANGHFTAEGLALAPGENQIVISARDEAGNTSRSDLVLNGKDFTPPPPVVIFPVSPQTRLNLISVEGRADSSARVTVTGGAAPVTVDTAFGTGLFTAAVTLTPGTNTLTAVAASADGINSTPAQVTVVSDPNAAPPPAGQPSQINISTGDAQKGLPGAELARPLIAVVTDSAGQPTPGVLVTFTALQGGGTFADSVAATYVVPTDAQGYARARYVAGEKPGVQLVRANFGGNLLAPVSFTAEALEVFDGVETTVAGVVLDQNLRALPNVLVRLGGQQARTGSDGRFAIENPPTGPHQVLELIGREQVTLPGRWPNISYDMDVLPGVVNTLGRPLFLPKVNDGINMPLDTGDIITQDTTFELPIKAGEAPVRVTARAGTRVSFPPDVTDKRLSVTRIPNDRVPMPLEDGRATNLYVSVQPSGAIFDPPLEVSFPNLDREPADAEVLLMSFDHDAGRYVKVGTGRVSADGRSVTSEPGSGIRVGAWHAFPPEPPKPEVTVLGYIQIAGNPAFEDKAITDDMVWLGGVRAVKTTAAGTDAPRWDYRLTKPLENGAEPGRLNALVYPVEAEIKAEVIDHDDPARSNYTTLDRKGAAYVGGEASTSDFLRLHLTFKDQANVPVKSINWSIKGPGSSNYTPPKPSPTATDWDLGQLKEPFGRLTFIAVIRFVNGSTYPVIRDIDVGYRSDDIMVVGWINPDGVNIPGAADSAYINQIMPAGGRSNDSNRCNIFIGNLSRNITSQTDFSTITPADRQYILHWMFKYGSNRDPSTVIPGGNFRDASDQRIDWQKVNDFSATLTNYKLFNRLQVKMLLEATGFKNTKIIQYSPGGVGTTENPCGTLLGGLAQFPGQRGPNNQSMRNTKTEVSVVNEGSPDAGAIRAFNTLMGKDLPQGQTPLFWESIGSAISFRFKQDGGFSMAEPKYYFQPYPTYNVYVNGRLIGSRPQAATPTDHFYRNPYPFGTVPCSLITGTTPGGRCGDAESFPEPDARVPDIIKRP